MNLKTFSRIFLLDFIAIKFLIRVFAGKPDSSSKIPDAYPAAGLQILPYPDSHPWKKNLIELLACRRL